MLDLLYTLRALCERRLEECDTLMPRDKRGIVHDHAATADLRTYYARLAARYDAKIRGLYE